MKTNFFKQSKIKFMSYKLESHRGAPIFNECPKCSTENFQHYVMFYGGALLPNHVGKCNVCKYDYRPYDFQRLECIIPENIIARSLLNHEKSNFFLRLSKTFGEHIAMNAMEMYSVGTAVSGKYAGASIFWYINKDKVCHDGSMILFDNGGVGDKRIRSIRHSLKIRSIEAIPCLFGEHLLNDYPLKKVVIVENEREAIFSSCKYPGYLWLSGRPLNCLTEIEKEAIANRTVICDPKTWGRR